MKITITLFLALSACIFNVALSIRIQSNTKTETNSAAGAELTFSSQNSNQKDENSTVLEDVLIAKAIPVQANLVRVLF